MRSRRSDQRVLANTLGSLLATRQGRMVLLVVAIVAAAVGVFILLSNPGSCTQQSSPTAPAANPGQIRIASWNIRRFTDELGADGKANDLVAIARIIKESNFDLVVVQEVMGKGQVVEKLRRQLNEPWRHAVTRVSGQHKNPEKYGFLWRSDKVDMIGDPRLAEGSDASSFTRAPAMASFRAGNFDFTIVTVHLYYGEDRNNDRRRTEAEALVRITRTLVDKGPERDIIVLGDFNEMRSGPNLPMFDRIGFVRLNKEPTNLGDREVFDNILIHSSHTKEWAGNVGVVRFDETVYNNDDARARSELSDHRPVWADFKTTEPDDD